MRADYDLGVKRRTDLAMERIAQEEARAVKEVRSRAADLAIRATRRLLVDKVGDWRSPDPWSRVRSARSSASWRWSRWASERRQDIRWAEARALE